MWNTKRSRLIPKVINLFFFSVKLKLYSTVGSWHSITYMSLESEIIFLDSLQGQYLQQTVLRHFFWKFESFFYI